MAQYEVVEKTFLDFLDGRGSRLIKVGERVNFKGWPNAALSPIDDEAVAHVEALEKVREKHGGKFPFDTPAAYLSPDPLAGKRVSSPNEDALNAVSIPPDWRSAKPLMRLNIGKKLGLGKTAKVADADAAIGAELERRASQGER